MDQSHASLDSFVTAPERRATGSLASSRLLAEATKDEAKLEKEAAIVAACRAADVQGLSRLAANKGGFLSDDLRRRAWPVLLGCGHGSKEAAAGEAKDAAELKQPADWMALPVHKDEDQVQLDVDRAFVYYPKELSETELQNRRLELRQIIVRVLRQHPMLCYFQGYHDIVQVMLLVLGKDEAHPASAHLSILRIRDFMLPSLSPSLVHLQLLPSILYAADREIHRHLSGIRPHFALAAALTLYAHEVEEYTQIARLFDFLLAHEAVISMYLFASIIISRREELLEIPVDEPDILAWKLTKIPGSLDIEKAIESCLDLYQRYPPERLPFRAWHRISAYSVLKTTRAKQGEAVTVDTAMSLQEGEAIFASQAKQLRRQEERQRLMAAAWRHRRSIGGLTLAVLVGVFSIWAQRNGIRMHLSFLRPLKWAFDRLAKDR